MALIVHKYGGTSMGSTERIRNVAKRVAKWTRAGHQIVVVPSAMSGETNRLLGLAKELAPAKPDTSYSRELDMLASTGEQASSALLAIALPTILPGYHMPNASAGEFSNMSFNLRVEMMWPKAWDWVARHGTFPFDHRTPRKNDLAVNLINIPLIGSRNRRSYTTGKDIPADTPPAPQRSAAP